MIKRGRGGSVRLFYKFQHSVITYWETQEQDSLRTSNVLSNHQSNNPSATVFCNALNRGLERNGPSSYQGKAHKLKCPLPLQKLHVLKISFIWAYTLSGVISSPSTGFWGLSITEYILEKPIYRCPLNITVYILEKPIDRCPLPELRAVCYKITSGCQHSPLTLSPSYTMLSSLKWPGN